MMRPLETKQKKAAKRLKCNRRFTSRIYKIILLANKTGNCILETKDMKMCFTKCPLSCMEQPSEICDVSCSLQFPPLRFLLNLGSLDSTHWPFWFWVPIYLLLGTFTSFQVYLIFFPLSVQHFYIFKIGWGIPSIHSVMCVYLSPNSIFMKSV